MEQRISLITLAVLDLERSRAFYAGLGWQPAALDAPGVVFFQCGGLIVGLYPRAELMRDLGIRDDGATFGGITLAYNTRSREEVDAVLHAAEGAGGEIIKPGHDICWGGYVGFFRDPDGHIWEVAWNPGFRITEDGGVFLPG